MWGAIGNGTSKFYVDLTGTSAPVSKWCKPSDDRCFRIVIDCVKETDTDKQLVLCKDAKQVNASAFGCAQNKDDNVCDDVTVRAQGGST